MNKTYNKLVRDKIPAIIESAGKECTTEILSDVEYLKMLDAKLNEECAEYQADKSIEELADIMEVVYAIAKVRGCSLEKLESIRKQKAEQRGGFEKRILLKEVITKEG